MPSWGPASRLSPVSLLNPSARDRGQRCQAPQALLSVNFSAYFNKGVTRSHMNQRCRSKRPVGVEQLRALRLLASIPLGTAETIVLAHHGFKRRTLADLLHAGLATLERASVNKEGTAIGAGRVRITAAGLSALEDWPSAKPEPVWRAPCRTNSSSSAAPRADHERLSVARRRTARNSASFETKAHCSTLWTKRTARALSPGRSRFGSKGGKPHWCF
jgi:hypothetical protein